MFVAGKYGAGDKARAVTVSDDGLLYMAGSPMVARDFYRYNDRIEGSGADPDDMAAMVAHGVVAMMISTDKDMPAGLPRVEYENSMQGEIVDSWRLFLATRVMPAEQVCPGCHGIIRLTEPWHLYGDVSAYRLMDQDMRVPYRLVSKMIDGITNAMVMTLPKHIQTHYQRNPWNREQADEQIIETVTGSAGVMIARWREDIHAAMGPIDQDNESGPLYTYCSTCRRYCAYEMPGHIPARLRDDLTSRIVQAHGIRDITEPPPIDQFIAAQKESDPLYRNRIAGWRHHDQGGTGWGAADPARKLWGQHRRAMESSRDYRMMIRAIQGAGIAILMLIVILIAISMWG